MMTNDSETVSEVCDLIRIHRLDLFKTYGELADRILSAYEREMAAKDAEIERMIVAHNAAIDTMQSRIDEMVEIVAAKDAEIARMKKALKPVLECSTFYSISCGEEFDADECVDAVREAQRIMKEGEKNNERDC